MKQWEESISKATRMQAAHHLTKAFHWLLNLFQMIIKNKLYLGIWMKILKIKLLEIKEG